MSLKIEKHENANVIVSNYISAGDVQIYAGDGAQISIGPNCVLGHLFIYACAGACVQIGPNVGFNGRVRLLLHEKRRISIGAGCLIAGDTDFTVSDMHSIIDLQTSLRINPARDISVSDKVRIGQSSLILKGSMVGSGSVIGARSVVTGNIPPNSMAVGSPARVIRSGITWQHSL